MGWYHRLQDWSRQYDLRKFGWRGTLQCSVVMLAIFALGALSISLLPSHRHIIARVMLVFLGLGIGFVYERNSGPLELLIIIAATNALITIDKKQPILVALRVAVPLMGFALSYITGRRRLRVES